jgi:hypothetical protein
MPEPLYVKRVRLKVRAPPADPAFEVYIFLGVNTGVPRRQLDSCFASPTTAVDVLRELFFSLARETRDLKERNGAWDVRY